MLVGLLVGLWVARYLGPEQFGVFSYAVAFAALFSIITKFGLDTIVVRDLVRLPDQSDLYLGTAFWLKLGGAVVMLAVLALAALLTSNDTTTTLYVLVIASGAIFQAFEVVDFYFQSKVLSRFVSVCKLTQLMISSLLKVYLILTGAGLFWFVLVTLVDQITLALSLIVAYRYQKLGGFYRYFDRIIAGKLLSESWPLTISGLAVIVYVNIDQIMIKDMLGVKDVGMYSAVVRLSVVWYYVPVIIANSLFPAIVNAKKISLALYYSRLRRLYTLMFWSAAAIALPVSFFSEWLVTVLYGEAYSQAGKALMIHVWTGVFAFLGIASGKWFVNEGLQKYYTINNAAGAVANIALNYLLIPIYGICGAAISAVLSQAVAMYFMNLVFEKTRINFLRITESMFFYGWFSRVFVGVNK